MDKKRVVVTGIGVVAPNGIGIADFWDSISSGVNAVKEISFFDSSTFSSKAAAEIRNYKPDYFIKNKSEIKRMGRSSHLAVGGSLLAIEDSKLSVAGLNPNDIGIILGSAVSGLEYVETDFRALERGGPSRVRPFLGIAGFGGAISSEISRALGVNGMSLTVSTGCTAATDAMGYSLQRIRGGESKVIITGGADACVTPGILAAFCQMGAVSTWTKNLEKASRPYNKDRDGFVISEGAWIYIFEELEHALNRNAKIYCEVKGYGATCDAWHMAKPVPSGDYSVLAIKQALKMSETAESDVDVFASYGNGTPINDSHETAVVKKTFGDHSKKIAMPSIKSMIGHPLGASGAQQLTGALMSFSRDIIHPTINYEVPDPLCDLDYVPNIAKKLKAKNILVNSIAFGAKNACLIVGRYN